MKPKQDGMALHGLENVPFTGYVLVARFITRLRTGM